MQIAGITLPRLTSRVRIPSPAPRSKAVYEQQDPSDRFRGNGGGNGLRVLGRLALAGLVSGFLFGLVLPWPWSAVGAALVGLVLGALLAANARRRAEAAGRLGRVDFVRPWGV